MKKIALFIPVLLLFAACHNNHDYAPKPRGYYRIIFPPKAYQQFTGPYPFTFIYPKYAVIEKDTNSIPGKNNKKLINMKYRDCFSRPLIPTTVTTRQTTLLGI